MAWHLLSYSAAMRNYCWGLRLKCFPFPGTLAFEETATVRHHVEVDGLVNGVDLDMDVVTINTLQNITGQKILVSAYFSKNVEVEGLVNHRNLPELFQDTFTMTEDQNITGHKHIKVTSSC